MGQEKIPTKQLAICLAVQTPLFLLALYLVWGADIWTGVSLIYSAYVICVAYVSVMLLLPCFAFRRAPVMVIPALWLIFAASLPFMDNSSIKPLLRGARDLDIGMSKEEVLQTLDRHYVGSSYPTPVVFREDESHLCIKPRGRDPVFSAESLLVDLQDGRFVRAHFSAD